MVLFDPTMICKPCLRANSSTAPFTAPMLRVPFMHRLQSCPFTASAVLQEQPERKKEGKITPWLLGSSPVGLSQGGQSVIDVPAAWVNGTKAVSPC